MESHKMSMYPNHQAVIFYLQITGVSPDIANPRPFQASLAIVRPRGADVLHGVLTDVHGLMVWNSMGAMGIP